MSKTFSAETLRAIAQGYGEVVPHNMELGIRATDCGNGWALTQLPWRPDWLADEARGVIHTGLLTTLFDGSAGLAVFTAAGTRSRIATLDLRMDYLRPAFAGQDLFCRADCFRLTERIAFVRGQIYQQTPDEPVAVCQATFMRGTSKRSGQQTAETPDGAAS